MLNISAHGSRDGVKKAIQGYKLPEDLTKDKPRAAELEGLLKGVKAFLVAEVDALAKEVNGCSVNANADCHANGRNFQAAILPLKLHL